MTTYDHLRAPIELGPTTLRNRVVMGSHGTRLVDHRGHPDERQRAYLTERARGGVGLIVSGATAIHPTGRAGPGYASILDDGAIVPHRELANAVHEHGTAIFAQIQHMGRIGTTFANQRELWAPSAVPDPMNAIVPHAMSSADIAEVLDGYRTAAARFAASGFDGLEISMNHGYLLGEYLSPFSNVRDDAYGGDDEGRTRLPREVIAAVAEEVGGDLTIGIRVSSDESVLGGLDTDAMVHLLPMLLDGDHVDVISVSQGIYASLPMIIPDMSYGAAPFVERAARIRGAAGGIPVMAAGRILTPDVAEQILADELVDLVVLVRPLIADAEWVKKALDGEPERIRPCTGSNIGCRGGPDRGFPIACLVNPDVGREHERPDEPPPAEASPQKVLVVGGGPAGLTAAEQASRGGHDVTIVDAAERFGGAVQMAAAAMPYRQELLGQIRHLEEELKRFGVTRRLGEVLTAEEIVAASADVTIVATGSWPTLPDLDGVTPDREDLTTPEEVLGWRTPFRSRASTIPAVRGQRRSWLVVDGGEADWRCMSTAEHLAAAGHEVTVVTPGQVAQNIEPFSRMALMQRLIAAGVRFVERASAVRLEDDRLIVRDGLSRQERELPADRFVFSWFRVAADELHAELVAAGLPTVLIGDALSPRQAIDAVWDGARAGRAIGRTDARRLARQRGR